MTQAIRHQLAWTKEGADALSRENQQAIARLDYDPATAPERPSPEQIQRQSRKLLEWVRSRAKAPPS